MGSRNFHARCHRRFCDAANKVTSDKELEYATKKITENFSNYSAWHYHSTLLSQLVKAGGSKEKIIKDEYKLVNQAYFTEPDDQAAWFYNTWLLGETQVNFGARLVGTWPLDGCTIRANPEKESRAICFTSRNLVDVEYNFYSKWLPVILCFNEVITDVVVKLSSEPELGVTMQLFLTPSNDVEAKKWGRQFETSSGW